MGVVIPDLTKTKCCTNSDSVLVKGELDGSSTGQKVVAVYAKAMTPTDPVNDVPDPADKMDEYSGNNEKEDYELVVPYGVITQEEGKIVVWGGFVEFSHEVHSYDCRNAATTTPSTVCPVTFIPTTMPPIPPP